MTKPKGVNRRVRREIRKQSPNWTKLAYLITDWSIRLHHHFDQPNTYGEILDRTYVTDSANRMRRFYAPWYR